MSFRLFAILLSLAVLAGCGSRKTVVYPACKIRPNPHPAPELSHETKISYLDAVNRMRAKPRRCGNKVYAAAKPLQWDDTLYKAAYEHSKDMAMCCHFSHEGSGRESDWTAKAQSLGRCSSFVNRIENNGYTKHRTVAENIAYGANTLEGVMRQWIGSEGHCRNIMNPLFTDFGMAKAAASDGRYYWTQTFGADIP